MDIVFCAFTPPCCSQRSTRPRRLPLVQFAIELKDGDAGLEVCWWGDMTLLPHFWNLAGKKSIRARIVFGEPLIATGDRKRLSHVLHERVAGLYGSGSAVETVAAAVDQ